MACATGSVYWNAFRKHWVMIISQIGGTSLLGEVWYAEADTPVGPWRYARKIITHNNYTFYNVTQDPFLDAQGGKRIYLEGTYTRTFTHNEDPTPRYEYNQMMYGLTLTDERLNMPLPIYQIGDMIARPASMPNLLSRSPAIAFYAPIHEAPGLIPISATRAGSILDVDNKPVGKPFCYAYPADAVKAPAATVPLYTYRLGSRVVLGIHAPEGDGWQRSDAPIGRVWPGSGDVFAVDWRIKAADN